MSTSNSITYLIRLSYYAEYLVGRLDLDMELEDVRILIANYDKRSIDELYGSLTFSNSGDLCRTLMESIDYKRGLVQYIANMMTEFLEQIPFDIKDNPKLLKLIAISSWVLSFEERVMSEVGHYLSDLDIELWLDLLLDDESDLNRLIYAISF